MSCKICERMKEKDEILYEDEIGIVLAGDAILGHITVHPKKHVQKLEELDDAELEHLFTIANLGSTVVFETLGAQGTNIVAHNSTREEHLSIQVIPRTMNDDLNLHWQPKTIPEEEMKDALERIKDKADYIEAKVAERKQKKPATENGATAGTTANNSAAQNQGTENTQKDAKGKKNANTGDEKESYLTKHLERMP